MKKPSPWPYIVGGAVAGTTAALPAALAYAFLHPPRRRHFYNPKTRLGLDYERMLLTSDDGITLSAWYVPHPSPRGVVVLSHGYSSCRETMLPYLAFLHAGGFAGVMYDFRAHGWSDGERVTLGLTEPADCRAAIAWARARPELADLPLVLLGESMGASVSILTAASDPRVRAVVADCGFARLDSPLVRRVQTVFGDRLGGLLAPPMRFVGERLLGTSAARVAPEEAIAELAPRPIFLIHGTADALVTPDNARRLSAAAGENATLWLVDGAAHARSIRTAPDYGERVMAFLDGALMPPP